MCVLWRRVWAYDSGMRTQYCRVSQLTARSVFFALLALPIAPRAGAQTWTYTTVYSFHGGSDGSSPVGVAIGGNKALYGVTTGGGAGGCDAIYSSGCGGVFELAPSGSGWLKTTLFDFNGSNGAQPAATPVLGHDGVLYGTTTHGGSDQGGLLGGTVFQLTPPANLGGTWSETTLYNYPRNYTAQTSPTGQLVIGPNGSLYGTAFNPAFTPIAGQPDGGVVYTLTPPGEPGGAWTNSVLYNFALAKAIGLGPEGGLVAVGESLYGTTAYNSYADYTFSGCGTVFELSPPAVAGSGWTGTEIYTFAENADGCNSGAPLTVGAGVLYGVTYFGGTGTCVEYSSDGCGVVFQLTPPAVPGGAWTESVIHNFAGTNADGIYPQAGLVLGKNGVLYGTATNGGGAGGCFGGIGCGVVFQLTPPAAPGGAWTETILHAFSGENGDGAVPGPGSLSLGSDGVLYGTTTSGGTAGAGVVFSLAP
jgi:uncharacterized repeat protein (TIGR03803 family)